MLASRPHRLNVMFLSYSCLVLTNSDYLTVTVKHLTLRVFLLTINLLVSNSQLSRPLDQVYHTH